MEPVLQGNGLTVSFGDSPDAQVTVLRDVTIRVDAGQMVLIMGPSGSGKSTLLAVLGGLLRPTRGEVLVQGEKLWGLSVEQRKHLRLKRFGFIFQGFNLFPALTALEQLEIVLRWGGGVGSAEATREAKAVLTLLGLGQKLNLRPAQLSGGEKQRVAIGRALVKRPAVCFADEPTSALDWAHGEQVIGQLRSASRARGTTALIVAHDSRLIPFMDRVLYLNDGQLTERPLHTGGGGEQGPRAEP